MKISFIKEDGTIRGAWVATFVTVITFAIFIICLFWEAGALNLQKFGIYLVSAYSVSIGAYFLKKYKEKRDE